MKFLTDYPYYRNPKFCYKLAWCSYSNNIFFEEWKIHTIKHGVVDCFCGENTLGNIFTFYNDITDIYIDVCKLCIHHFPSFDIDDEKIDKTVLSESSVNVDDEVVFVKTVVDLTNDDIKVKTEKDVIDLTNDDEYEYFEYKDIISFGKDKSLLSWRDTVCNKQTYVRLMEDYRKDVKNVVRNGNSYTISWNDSFVETTPELANDYLFDYKSKRKVYNV